MDKDRLNNEHDKGYKHLLSHKRTFIQLLRSFVNENWVNEIDESNIVHVNKSYILQDFEEKEADIVYMLKSKDKNIIFYCLLELQSTVDFQMPFRLLLYMIEIWRDILKNTKMNEREQKDFRLPSIVPIVLYNGSNNWTACRNFKETLEGSEIFGNHILDFNYILFDVNRYKEKDLLETANLVSAVFLLDQKIEPVELKDRLIKLVEILKNLSSEEFSLFKNWFKMVVNPRVPNDLRPKVETIIDESMPKEVEKMVSNLALTIDELVNNAKEEGKLQVARTALENGADIDFVSKITGLDKKVIELLKSNLSN